MTYIATSNIFYSFQHLSHLPFFQHLLEALQSPRVDVNLKDDLTGDAPIHSIIRRKKKDRVELLLTLLINSNADVNLPNRRNMTALHCAIEVGLQYSIFC